jgi:hypothetical protein
MMKTRVIGIFAFLLGSAVACGGPQATAPVSPVATEVADAPDDDDAGDDSADGGADGNDAAGDGGASADGGVAAADAPPDPASGATAEPAVVPPPPPPRRSGRPAIQYGPSKKIESTFGSTPAASLKLKASGGTIVFKIPEFALRAGTNITWKIASARAPRKRPLVGSICEIIPTIGGKLKPSKIDSDGPKFQFRFPTGGRDSINLAVGVTAGRTKYGREKTEWTVYAPTRIDKGFKEAYFEIGSIEPSFMHATTASVTEAAPAPASEAAP